MARIKLLIPEYKLATINVPVRITDINYGNHLGNDALVSIIHEARVHWLNQLGYSELDIEGTSLIMSDLAVEYLKESFYGDLLEVSISPGDVTRAGFELFYNINTTREGNSITIARAKTGMVCYDYAAKKVSVVPEKLREILTDK